LDGHFANVATVLVHVVDHDGLGAAGHDHVLHEVGVGIALPGCGLQGDLGAVRQVEGDIASKLKRVVVAPPVNAANNLLPG
jgi:hypothetical protein